MYESKIFLLGFIFSQGISETISATRGDCDLPTSITNGWWSILFKPSNTSNASQAPHNSVLEIHCKEDYKLDICGIVVCRDAKWVPPIGRCLQKCPSLCSTSTLKVTCTYKGQEMVNCTEPVEGTLAQFTCAPFYEDPRVAQYKAKCHFGSWTEKAPECTPACARAKKRSLVVTKRDVFPWQIALYRASDKVLRCGGTLLSEKITLTAAHCIMDASGTILPKNHYIVAAGKNFRKLNHPGDQIYSQTSEIHNMFVFNKYKGEDYEGNIAVIITKTSFQLSGKIQPACIDWSKKYLQGVFASGNQKGNVIGWSQTKDKHKPGEESKSLVVPCIPPNECRKFLPDELRRYITSDKFCISFKENSSSACDSDSGGALILKKQGKVFIAGIVSLTPRATATEECDTQQYSFITLVYNYTDNFILKKMEEFKSSDSRDVYCKDCPPPKTNTTEAPVTVSPPTTPDGCILPEHPESGQWSVLGDPCELSPGDFVPSDTTLHVECNPEYVYTGPRKVACINGKWSEKIGHCLKKCLPFHQPYFQSHMKVTCTYNNTVLKNCENALDGTVATATCDPYYELATENAKPSVCVNGRWSSIPQCVPACGRVLPGPIFGPYPWHVIIYRRLVNGTIVAFCDGSFIGTRIIVTAARCVTYYNGTLLPKENFMIGAGKYYQEFYQEEQDQTAQFHQVKEILIPRQYKGEPSSYLGDIAIIVTETAPTLSYRVQPICIDWATNLPLPVNQEGFLSRKTFVDNAVWVPRNFTVISLKECTDTIDDDHKRYLTNDKFCGKLLVKDSSLCTSNAGGGLIFEERNRYYLGGVFNFYPSSLETGLCDNDQNAVFTATEFYIDDFILEAHIKYRHYVDEIS